MYISNSLYLLRRRRKREGSPSGGDALYRLLHQQHVFSLLGCGAGINSVLIILLVEIKAYNYSFNKTQ